MGAMVDGVMDLFFWWTQCCSALLVGPTLGGGKLRWNALDAPPRGVGGKYFVVSLVLIGSP